MKKNVLNKNLGAPAGIRTRVFGSKGRNDWPDYTTGARCILSETSIICLKYINLSIIKLFLLTLLFRQKSLQLIAKLNYYTS